MTAIAAPIHTQTVNGVQVRYFRAPDNVVALPWHSFFEICEALEFPAYLRTRFLQTVPKGRRDGVATIATAIGLTIIAPHPSAQALLEIAEKEMGLHVSVGAEYRRGMVYAMKALNGDLPPIASFQRTIEAARNTLGIGDAS